MGRKRTYKPGSDYPHYSSLGAHSGTEDLDNRPLGEKYRERVPKSLALIRIGATEEPPHGTLRCFMRGELAVVGL